jgi:hypothetical protein
MWWLRAVLYAGALRRVRVCVESQREEGVRFSLPGRVFSRLCCSLKLSVRPAPCRLRCAQTLPGPACAVCCAGARALGRVRWASGSGAELAESTRGCKSTTCGETLLRRRAGRSLCARWAALPRRPRDGGWRGLPRWFASGPSTRFGGPPFSSLRAAPSKARLAPTKRGRVSRQKSFEGRKLDLLYLRAQGQS